ncbi:MAG: AAA family ATPase, partial [Conexivisphaera sp.]
EGELRRISGSAQWLRAKGIGGPGDLDSLRREREELVGLLSRIPEDPASSMPEELALDQRSSEMAARVLQLRRESSGYSESRFRELEERLRAADERAAGLAEELGGARRAAESAARDREERERALSVLRRAEAYARILEDIRSRVFHRDGQLAAGLRDWAMEALSDAASEHMREFEMGISILQLREGEGRDVEIVCYGPSGEMSAEQMSGGERVAVALALRFAMARLIGGSRADFIILDEPTANLDAERRRKLVELIGRLGSYSGSQPQIILITHDREAFEESNVDVAAVYQFSKGPEGTSVSRVT